LDEHVFKAALKKVAASKIPDIESFGVSGAKPLHAFRLGWFDWFETINGSDCPSGHKPIGQIQNTVTFRLKYPESNGGRDYLRRSCAVHFLWITHGTESLHIRFVMRGR
jgi:hypothetical protein